MSTNTTVTIRSLSDEEDSRVGFLNRQYSEYEGLKSIEDSDPYDVRRYKLEDNLRTFKQRKFFSNSDESSFFESYYKKAIEDHSKRLLEEVVRLYKNFRVVDQKWKDSITESLEKFDYEKLKELKEYYRGLIAEAEFNPFKLERIYQEATEKSISDLKVVAELFIGLTTTAANDPKGEYSAETICYLEFFALRDLMKIAMNPDLAEYQQERFEMWQKLIALNQEIQATITEMVEKLNFNPSLPLIESLRNESKNIEMPPSHLTSEVFM